MTTRLRSRTAGGAGRPPSRTSGCGRWRGPSVASPVDGSATCSTWDAVPRRWLSSCQRGVRYHGIDIAIQEPASNLIETDIIEAPIAFGGKTFDVIVAQDRKSTRLNSSHEWISYAVFCLK